MKRKITRLFILLLMVMSIYCTTNISISATELKPVDYELPVVIKK